MRACAPRVHHDSRLCACRLSPSPPAAAAAARSLMRMLPRRATAASAPPPSCSFMLTRRPAAACVANKCGREKNGPLVHHTCAGASPSDMCERCATVARVEADLPCEPRRSRCAWVCVSRLSWAAFGEADMGRRTTEFKRVSMQIDLHHRFLPCDVSSISWPSHLYKFVGGRKDGNFTAGNQRRGLLWAPSLSLSLQMMPRVSGKRFVSARPRAALSAAPFARRDRPGRPPDSPKCPAPSFQSLTTLLSPSAPTPQSRCASWRCCPARSARSACRFATVILATLMSAPV